MSQHAAANYSVQEYRVGLESDIPEKGSVLVQAGEMTVGVFKVHGELHAYENRCPHQGGPVCQGEILGRTLEVLAPDKTKIAERESDRDIHLVCPWHGYEYNLETGRCFAEPRLHLFPIEVVVRDGEVFVRV